ncbi:MAG: NUDIX hydrolase [Eubacteriales bacterium]
MYIPSSREEEDYLKNYDPSNWPKPAVAADIAVFGYSQKKLYLLLVVRGNYPYRGCYALPGGFANMDEDILETASRELAEETGLEGMYLEHISVWGKPGRDPRDRTITSLHLALIDKDKAKVDAGDDASSAHWFEVKNYIENKDFFETDNVVRTKKLILEGDIVLAPQIRQTACYGESKCLHEDIIDDSDLAFDHASGIINAYEKLKERLLISEIAYSLLGRVFKLEDMKALYDTVFQKSWQLDELAALKILERKSANLFTWSFC